MKTPSGYRNIEELRAGDEVLSYNEHTKRLEVQTVAQTFIRKTDRVYTLVYDTGTKLQTTATHPFYIEGKGWVKAADLHIGDDSLLAGEVSPLDIYGGARLQNVSYRQSKQGVIVGITVEERPETVYNFEVNETHTYLVGESDVVVHNAGYAAEAPVDPMQNADGTYNIDKINERYSGIGRFRILGEALWNGLSLRGFQRDYLVREDAGTFDKNLDQASRERILGTLNNLTTSVDFQEGKNGQMVMVSRGDVEEKYQSARELLTGVFGDKNHQVVFANPADRFNGAMNTSSHLSAVDAAFDIGANSSGLYSRYGAESGGRTRSFVFYNPSIDATKTSVFDVDDGPGVEKKVLNLDDGTINLAHELIHSNRYRLGLTASRILTEKVPVFNSQLQQVKTAYLKREEVYTVGKGILTIGPVNFQSGPSENDLRRERKLPIRLTYSGVAP